MFIHYQLPFWSIVLIGIGGYAIGMRSMSIYELNADYVKYSRFMGIKDRKIIGYVFRECHAATDYRFGARAGNRQLRQGRDDGNGQSHARIAAHRAVAGPIANRSSD